MYEEDLHAAKFVLVDHYRPTYPKIRKDHVVAIFDHHMDYMNAWPDMPAALEKYVRIRPYGSSATVVAEFVFELIGTQKPSLKDLAVLRLLHGPIYLDTDNLREDKASAQDIVIANSIERVLKEQKMDRDLMFQALSAALVDLTGLSLTQILRKDLKIASFEVRSHESPFSIKVAVPYMPMTPLVKSIFRLSTYIAIKIEIYLPTVYSPILFRISSERMQRRRPVKFTTL